jgi:hypothetical protein
MADYENRLRRLEAIANSPAVEPIRILRTIIDPGQRVTSVRAEGQWFYRQDGELETDLRNRVQTSLGWSTQPAEARNG